MNRTIATLTAVVVLTLATCGSGTSDTTTTIPTTTTTVDTRGWSDEAFRDLMAYCQASRGDCASLIIWSRDTAECSVEATYRTIDDHDAFDELMRDVFEPAGDCLGYDLPDE